MINAAIAEIKQRAYAVHNGPWLPAADIEAVFSEIERLAKDLAEWKKHAAESDKELCTIEDWLACPPEMIDATDKLKERVRDLVAKEGQIGDLNEELTRLRVALDARNEIEAKAHALFTDPLGGQKFAHLPHQCNPLGFVKVLREAIKKLMDGERLSNPFILLEKEERKP